MSGAGHDVSRTLELFERELEDVIHQLDRMGHSAQKASTSSLSLVAGIGKSVMGAVTGPLNFATRTAALTARRFARGAAIGALTHSMELGTTGVSGTVIEAAAATPILGSMFQDYMGPMKAARNRVTGVLTRIAGAGGEVTKEDVLDLAPVFLEQEFRKRKAEKLVRKTFREKGPIREMGVGFADEEAGGHAFAVNLAIEVGDVLERILTQKLGL